MIIEISVAIAALAFVILVVYVIFAINALRKTLGQVDLTIVEVRKQLEETGVQAKKTVEHTNQVSFDLKRKMESLNSIFNSISNLGDILEHKTFTLKKEALASSHQEHKRLDSDAPLTEREFRVHEESAVAAIFELAGIGIRLWQKIKNKHSPVSKNKE